MNPYLGLVATRCGLCEEANFTNRQLMSRTGHFARTAIASLQLVLANWYVPVDSWVETGTGSTATVTAVDVVITASGGPVGPFRYAIIYNDTPTSPADPLVSYYDYGGAVTLADGEALTVDFGASLLTLA